MKLIMLGLATPIMDSLGYERMISVYGGRYSIHLLPFSVGESLARYLSEMSRDI